ncbi:hypothetical protein [Lutibacter maritimus]|uniref:Phage tail protein n=1 Tax=Lutibacter maritimus TaxID=593133 RepID=A0A1I6NSC4_9FLAO|nr:hypothetical protein [Lutibacter maritimus]SFS30833.1 hypothetical protein SAMN04488006_0493 [Lutibacter maritimus]
MYTIDNISFTTYGLHISTSKGIAMLESAKTELFTIYGKEGYQITKHKASTLELNGFIIANDITDFKSKINSLSTVFKSAGLRSIVLDNNAINCFAVDGFRIDKVRIYGKVYASFNIKLTIV